MSFCCMDSQHSARAQRNHVGATYLDIQSHIGHLQSRLLAHVHIDEVGGILVQDVDVAEAEEQKLFAYGRAQRGEPHEESHGGELKSQTRRWLCWWVVGGCGLTDALEEAP